MLLVYGLHSSKSASNIVADREKMNRLNKMIDRNGIGSLRDNQEARDEILRNSLIW